MRRRRRVGVSIGVGTGIGVGLGLEWEKTKHLEEGRRDYYLTTPRLLTAITKVSNNEHDEMLSIRLVRG